MRAVTMQDAKLTVAMIADPVPGPGEVLVDVLACGICGTDLHCAAHGPELNAATKGAAGIELMDLSRPIVFGHEFVGRVVSYGPGTEARIPVGRRVVSMPVLPREQPVLLGFAGPEAPGAYAERMVLSEPLLIEVPDHVSTEVAALTEPLAVAYRTVARAELASNDVPLVVGCGPIGLAVIAVLKMEGVGPIVACEFSAERRALAQRRAELRGRGLRAAEPNRRGARGPAGPHGETGRRCRRNRCVRAPRAHESAERSPRGLQSPRATVGSPRRA